MKGRYEDENLKWIPVLILAVFLLPFILKGVTFSYKYYLYICYSGVYVVQYLIFDRHMEMLLDIVSTILNSVNTICLKNV